MARPLPLPLLGFGGFPKLIEPWPIPLDKNPSLGWFGSQGVCLSPIVSVWVALALGDTIAGHATIESSHRGLVLGESSHN